MRKNKKISVRILSMALTAALAVSMLPENVFAAEGDALVEASKITECSTVQDKDRSENILTVAGTDDINNDVLSDAATMPTIETISGMNTIFANGTALVIEGTTDSTSTVYVDANRNGIKDSNEKSLNDLAITKAPEDNTDLSSWFICGGTNTAPYTGDTLITMNSGCVNAIVGGCYHANMTGDTNVTVKGGKVMWQIMGGNLQNGVITGSSIITVSNGKINQITMNTANHAVLSGNASVKITGGTVGNNYNGVVAGGTISGTKTLIIDGGSLTRNSLDITPTNSGGTELENYYFELSDAEGTEKILDIALTESYIYGAEGIVLDSSNYIYPWLPKTGKTFTSAIITTESKKYIGSILNKGATLKTATVTGVTVTPSSFSVVKGGTKQFSAVVAGTNAPNTVIWAMSGGIKPGTTLSAIGLLTVAADEPVGTLLTITATSTFDTSKSSQATAAVIDGPSVTVGAQVGTLTYGSTDEATFDVATSGFAAAPAVGDYTVNWFSDAAGTVSAVAPELTVTKTDTAIVTIAPGVANAGTYYFKMTAVKGSETATSAVATISVGQANASNAMKAVSTSVSKNGQAGAAVTLPTKPDGAVYGTPSKSGTISMADISIASNTLTYTVSPSAAGETGTITIPVTTAKNYKDYSIVVTITSTDKTPITVTGVNVANKTYDGGAAAMSGTPAYTLVGGGAVADYTGTWDYLYTGIDNSYSAAISPTGAGVYQLAVTANDAKYDGKQEIEFAISKASITVKANDKSAYVGSAVPLLSVSDYTIIGLASGETLKTVPTIVYDGTPDMTKVGTVTITISGGAVPDGGNYNNSIIYETGTLTISKKSSGGGGGSSSTTKPTEPVTGSSDTTATVDGKGNSTVNVTDKNISDAVQAAKDAASKKGVNAGEVTAVINVTTGGKDVDTVSVNLPKNVQEQIISNKIDSVAIVIDKPDISIGMTLATIKEMNKQANGDIQLSATRTDTSKLSAEAKNAIGSRPAFDLKATFASGAKSITDFGAGTVSVAIPYTLQKSEVAGGVYAVYVDGDGKVTSVKNSSYDAENKVLRFSTNHFSVYGIGYQAPVGFTDIANHWAKIDIEFVVNRSLMSGTSNTTFAPNSSMTRGMFVTALGRLAGIDTNSYKSGKFADVKADAYYASYVNWAADKGIVKGISATTFAPDQAISRQEMAVIMSNYAKAMGNTVAETRTAVTFVDNGSIGSWAAAAVKQMQMAGILNGRNNNTFDPAGTATRGEIATMLHQFVELVID